MIKHINHQNVSTTPFVATKARALFNIQGDDTIITEPDVYADGTHISLDYIDYNFGDPRLNGECNIALEQQGFDSLGYEVGVTGSGTFNSASDPRNTDGTYQTLVHQTIKNAFYNTYRNPTKIFGVEHIDFPLSKTRRNLSDHFRMFTVPRLVFGEKIQPKSVRFYDTLFDDNVAIYDDGYQNLIAGYNLFSRVQEVRKWPSGSNYILPGTASCNCPTYDSLFLTDPVDVYAEYGANVTFTVSGSGTPRPITYRWYTGSNAMSDGGQISGSYGSTLYINNVTFANTGSYRAMAHNAATIGATSSFATLYVLTHPPIIGDPNDDFEEIGSNFDFCVTLNSGSSPLYWQWYSGSTLLTDDAHYSGSNTQCLRVNNIQVADSGSYRVMIGNFFGQATSSWANGHVNIYAPFIISNPADQANYRGFPVSFSVSASGTIPITYQWYSGSTTLVDSDRITGSYLVNGTGSNLYINNLQMEDAGFYTVSASNWIGSVCSKTASLIVWDNAITYSAGDSAFFFSITIEQGSAVPRPIIDSPLMPVGMSLSGGLLTTVVLPISSFESTGSIGYDLLGGVLTNVVLTSSVSETTGSIGYDLLGGACTVVVITGSAVEPTGSIGYDLLGGSVNTVVTVTSASDTMSGISIGLISGSLA